ncbi:MAG: O-antigen/teichoic acid export membrane protein [Pirellulaceae bacterium]
MVTRIVSSVPAEKVDHSPVLAESHARTPSNWSALLAVFDQAVVSGSRFLATILIGRFCGPTELGNYSIAFASLIFAGCFLEALITTPYMVYSSDMTPEKRRVFAGGTLMHFLFLMICGSLATAGIAATLLANGATSLGWTLMVVAIVVPFSMLWEFARRFSFAHMEMHVAVIIDVSVATLQLAGILTLIRMNSLTASVAFVIIGASCGLVGALWLLISSQRFSFHRPSVYPAWQQNWLLGKWMAASQIIGSLQGHVSHWILAAIAGTFATGVFAACQTIVLLSNPLILAMCNILGPRAARARANGGIRDVARIVWKSAALLLTATVAFCGLLILFRESVVAIIFGDEFGSCGSILTVMSFAPLAWAVSAPVSVGLTVIERPAVNTHACLVGMLTTVLISLATVHQLGALGGSWALLMGSIVIAVIQSAAFVKYTAAESLE